MAIVKMLKISIAAHHNDRDIIIRRLERMGVVEISDAGTDAGIERTALLMADGDDRKTAAVEAQLALIREAMLFLCGYDKSKKPLLNVKKQMSDKDFEKTGDDFDSLMNTAAHLVEEQKTLAKFKNEVNQNRNLAVSLENWAALGEDLGDTETRSAISVLGSLPSAADAEALKTELAAKIPDSYVETVKANDKAAFLFIVYHRDNENELSGILKGMEFNRIYFKGMSGTASENITALNAKNDELRIEIERIESETAESVKLMRKFEIIHDHLLIEKEKLSVLCSLLKTDSTFFATGWVPASSAKKVCDTLYAETGCYVDTEVPGKDDEIPILLKNNKLIEPFEPLTEMFSYPNSRNIDPSPFVAFFYVIFFGMMLSDAAYGIILCVFTGVLIKIYNPKGTMGKTLRMFFLCGLSTIFWGAMFGGWMGDLASIISGGKFAIKPIWFNPLVDPMKMLIYALGFGAVQVLTGLGIKIYLMFKDGDWKGAVFDVLPWFPVIIGLGLMFVTGPVAVAGRYAAIAGALVLLLMKGRANRNPIKRILIGLYGLYDSVAYISDILSYSRLLALGMATGVIANVFNTMGALGGNSIGGVILFIVVVLIGTVFNIAVNTLGAYVHSTRLQYIEFFTKFYEGGGKAFRPFKAKTKYIEINDREAN